MASDGQKQANTQRIPRELLKFRQMRSQHELHRIAPEQGGAEHT